MYNTIVFENRNLSRAQRTAKGGGMKRERYTLFRSKRGFGLRIITAEGDTVEYPCISYKRDGARVLFRRLSVAGLDPAHFDDVVRDYITEQYLEQLALNGLA